MSLGTKWMISPKPDSIKDECKNPHPMLQDIGLNRSLSANYTMKGQIENVLGFGAKSPLFQLLNSVVLEQRQ